MKANKFFAAAMAALALVGFSSCKDKNDDNKSLELTETSISMKVGETHQLVANVTVETWSTSDEKVATVDKGMVTAVAEGTAIISATAKGTTKTCVVKVTKNNRVTQFFHFADIGCTDIKAATRPTGRSLYYQRYIAYRQVRN